MRKIKFAADCIRCDYCDQPWCADCEAHYADCDCVGPNSNLKEIMSEILVVTSRVKALVASKDGLRTSAEFITALSKEIEARIDVAVKKTVEAKRKTVFPEDLK